LRLHMLRFAICLSFLVAPLMSQRAVQSDQTGVDPYVRRYTRDVAARMKWELLWEKIPDGFKLPAGGTARLAVDHFIAGHILSYCSHDLGVCARYIMKERILTELIDSAPCTQKGTDMEALDRFDRSKSSVVSPHTGSIIAGELGGEGRTWLSITVELGMREKIVAKYKAQRPAELEGLVIWLTDGKRLPTNRFVSLASWRPTPKYTFTVNGARMSRLCLR
jgi:hypothetical protein